MSSRLPSRSATFYCGRRARERRSVRRRSIVWLRTNVRCSDVGRNITPLRDAVRSNARPLPPCPSAMALIGGTLGHPGPSATLGTPILSPPVSLLLLLLVAALFVVGPPKNLSWPEVSWSLSEEKNFRTVGNGGPPALPHPWRFSLLRICAVESADGCRRRSEGVSVLFGCVGLVVVRRRRDA